MDYPLYRSCGLPIGSGVVEGACKNVVAKRMKQDDVGAGQSQGDAAAPLLRDEPPVLGDYESLLPASPASESDEIQREAA